MLVVLSPAKTLDLSACAVAAAVKATTPSMLPAAHELLPVLQSKSAAELKTLFGVSDALASLNAQRFTDFATLATKPAAFAFDGPAYKGLSVSTLTAPQRDYCQSHLRILCGLYGVLKPLDALTPYRLEMSTKLPTSKGKDLYAFWGDSITSSLSAELLAAPAEQRFVVNCASQEYWKSVNVSKLEGTVYHMKFPGPAVHAKQARGAMVRYMAEAAVTAPQGLKGFVGSRGEWSFNDADSTDNEYIFHRDAAKAGAESKPTVAQAKPAKQKASAADAAEQPAVKKAKAEQPRRTTGRNRNADWNWEKRTVTE